MKINRMAVAGLMLLGMASTASAAGMMTDAKGMTLYSFDKDKGGTSACYDDCAVKWPPYLVGKGETKGEGWTQVARKDGAMQWAYDGKLLYLYAGDAAKGDKAGDGIGGVWHIVK